MSVQALQAVGAALAPTIGSFVGAHQDRAYQNKQFGDNVALQKEFAQNGIKWKVEDAARMGIHPLAAIGAPTQSFSPITTGDSQGEAFRDMGQNLNRALQSTKTAEERALSNLQLATAQADLDGKVLDNQIRASELRKVNMTGPAFPGASSKLIDGQGDSVVVKPSEIIASDKLDLSKEAGVITDYSFAQNSLGGLTPVPSSDVKSRIEDSVFLELPWAIRNNLLPNIGFHHKGVPDGYRWNPEKQHYEKGYYGPSSAQEYGRGFRELWKLGSKTRRQNFYPRSRRWNPR